MLDQTAFDLHHSSKSLPFRHAFYRLVLEIAVTAGLLLAGPAADAGDWDHAHGDAGNTSFNDVLTAPAGAPSATIGNLGPFAPGSGPVVGPDGTVYLASKDSLQAFSPNGALKWQATAQLPFPASPVVGADGSIYVVGNHLVHDHRAPIGDYYESMLFRYSPMGALLWKAAFTLRVTIPALAAPNIWRSGGTEVIMVPAMSLPSNYELRLLAFSTSGALLSNQLVTTIPYSGGDVTGDWGGLCIDFGCLYGDPETHLNHPANELDPDVTPPMPSVAISNFGSGGFPTVVVADNYEYIVGYSFSPSQGFQEIYRKHLSTGQISMTSPVLLRDGHAAIGADLSDYAWLLFGAPNDVANWTEVEVAHHTGATPSLDSTGNILVVNRAGVLTVVGVTPGRSILEQVPLGAQSIGPAATSHNHIFVSAADRLITLDAKTLEVITSIVWSGGGLSSPAIDDCGRVYALAGGTLYMFPAPPARRGVWRWCGAGRIFNPGGGRVPR